MSVSNKNLKIMELVNKIRTWAVAAGAEHEVLTNKYELVRLRVKGGVAIVYRRDNGKTTWNPLSAQLPGPEERILRSVASKYPNAATNEVVAEGANYSPASTSYTNPRSALKTKDLITYPSSGMVRAAEWLFT